MMPWRLTEFYLGYSEVPSQLLAVIKGEMSRDELQMALGLKDRKSFQVRYLNRLWNSA